MAAATDDRFLLSPGNRKSPSHAAPYSPFSGVGLDLDTNARKTTNDDDADLKCVLEFERELMDMEMGSCKVSPTIADSTNETKKVPDKVYAEVCAILAALPRQADAVLLTQDRLREQDRAPICYDYEKDELSPGGFKCYCTSQNRDPTCRENQTLLELRLFDTATTTKTSTLSCAMDWCMTPPGTAPAPASS